MLPYIRAFAIRGSSGIIGASIKKRNESSTCMASDPAQLIAHIRFALARLSERNAQHEWEHLCRHLTRARICSNILPATGPVQAGGDQGRGFETFHTYLSRSSLSQQSFVGLSSQRPIAFACSLEEQVIPKMHRDVKTIIGVDRDTCKSGHRIIVSHPCMTGCCHGEPERASNCTASSSADRCEGS